MLEYKHVRRLFANQRFFQFSNNRKRVVAYALPTKTIKVALVAVRKYNGISIWLVTSS